MKRKFLIVITLLTGLITFAFLAIDFNSQKNMESDGPDQYPAEWAWMQRTFPYFEADEMAQYDAMKQTQQIRSAAIEKAGRVSEAKWEFIGPVNIGGRVVDLEFNPLDGNTVYASAATGGIFKSYNVGETWFPVFDDQAVLPMGDLAIDPVDTNIVYAGTGEPNGSHNNFPGYGVFKSTDAGATWNNIGLELTAQIGRIIIDPDNTQRIFVAAVGSNFRKGENRGIYRSTNGGTDWEKVLFVDDSTGGIDVVMMPEDSNILHAAMWQRYRKAGYGQTETSRGPSTGIFRSTDGGDTWTELGTPEGLKDANGDNGRIGFAVCPSSPEAIIALYTDGGTYSGMYKSNNKGETWVNIDPANSAGQAVATFSWYFGQVRMHPNDENKIFMLDQYLAYSSNGGSTWSIVGENDTHVDFHAMAFHPSSPNIVLVGNDGGIAKSTNSGTRWSAEVDLPATQFYEIGLDYINPARVYGGTQDNNSIRTYDGGIDSWQRILGGDGFYVNVDYTDNTTFYMEYQYGVLYRFTNDGSNYDYIMNGIDDNEPKNWSTPVVMDPIDPEVLYYGSNRIYRTTNRGDNWTPISNKLTADNPLYPRFGTMSTIGVSIIDNDIIYAGTDDSHIWRTTDKGNTWTQINNGTPERWVTRVLPDPHDENVVYATFSGLKWGEPQSHVFRSSDMGDTWVDISSNLPDSPVNAIAVDYENPSWIFVGTDVGPFVSFDTGASWVVLGEGMPLVSVYDLKIHPTENFLVAGTHGRSMYKLDLNSLVIVEQDVQVAEDFQLKQNYPNPFNPSTTISFVAPKTGLVKIQVFDITGQLVKTLANRMYAKGTYNLQWNGRNEAGNMVASGTYIYRLESGSHIISKKMMLLK